MELFLLLTALISSLTGTVRTAVRAPEVVQAQSAVRAVTPAPAAIRALALVRAAPPQPRPDGYVAPAVFTPVAQPELISVPRAPERRRE